MCLHNRVLLSTVLGAPELTFLAAAVLSGKPLPMPSSEDEKIPLDESELRRSFEATVRGILEPAFRAVQVYPCFCHIPAIMLFVSLQAQL